MVKAVVGANWGDEGKGKITDMLAQEADIIVRFQGGANAGHTIINNYGKFALHTLPSGVFYGHTTSIIGNGVALDIPVLMKEINSIVERDVPMPKILVSDRAQMVMSYHKNFDAYEEERLGGKSFGSTKSGIAPFYSDKYAKIGFQVSELFDDDLLKEKVVRVAEQKNVLLEHLYHKPLINPDDLYKELQEYKEMIAPYVCDTSLFLHNAIKEGKNILLEGQLGSLKDPDHGIYPMVTSSSTLAGYGAIGAGIPPYEIQKIVKGYSPESMVIGEAPLTKDLQDVTDVDLKTVNTISILAIFIIIMVVFKSISLPFILVAVIEFAIFVNMSVPYYQGKEVVFVASIVIGCIQLGATVDYAILMTSRYQKERGLGKNKKEAIAIAHKTSMKSIVISGCSFFAATFGVGLYTQVDMIGSITNLLSRGAVISTLVVLLILPAMFMIFDPLICHTSIGFAKKKNAEEKK